MYKVRKKDGRLENFDRNKILNGLVNSGASSQDSETIIVQVEEWLPTVAINGIVNSVDIRDKVLELLREVDPVSAQRFETYKKPQSV